MNQKIKLSIIIIAKDEEKDVVDCLESVKWADEIVFVDTGSTDKTISIAKKFGVELHQVPWRKFEYDRWRNIGLKNAKGEWVFYVDADERVTPGLRQEIKNLVERGDVKEAAFMMPRRNFLLGKELHWGGWWPDYVQRLFKKSQLKGWQGDLHEGPNFDGPIGKLKNPLIHVQPEGLEPMLEKSIRWSEIEAAKLYQANHPPVVWWRILRMMATTLFDRLIKKQGFRDGTEGWIESIYQAFHTMIVYVRLWEKQRGDPSGK